MTRLLIRAEFERGGRQGTATKYFLVSVAGMSYTGQAFSSLRHPSDDMDYYLDHGRIFVQ